MPGKNATEADERGMKKLTDRMRLKNKSWTLTSSARTVKKKDEIDTAG